MATQRETEAVMREKNATVGKLFLLCEIAVCLYLDQGLDGYFGIWDLAKMWCRNWENDKYLDGIWDLTAPREARFAKIWAWDAGSFRVFVGNSGNHYNPNKRPSSQSRWCLLLNQTLECA